MKTLDWPPNFVARCPVKLFEAVGGSNASWISSGTSGEFYMRPLGNAALYFQLRDLLDNQILFEHTMHKPESFMVSAKRFFVIRLENGSFRGFGFADGNAAFEMKKQIQEAIKPYDIQDYVDGERSIIRESQVNNELIQASIPDQKVHANTYSTAVTSYGTLQKSSSSRQGSTEFMQEQPSSSPTTFKRKTKQNSPHFKWRLVFRGNLPRFSPRKGITSLSQILGWKEEHMEIGYPTDVKHVAHIGWDGPSVGGPSWINELKPAPNFSLGPLQEFGQPQGPEWIHDALSASQWTTPELREKSHNPIPPMPPGEFLDSDLLNLQGQKRKWKIFRLKNKLKPDTSAQC